MTNEKTQFIESFMASATTIGTKSLLASARSERRIFSPTGDLGHSSRTAGDEEAT